MYEHKPYPTTSTYRDQALANKLHALIVEIVQNELNESLNRMRGN
jgi:hypothetical protein